MSRLVPGARVRRGVRAVGLLLALVVGAGAHAQAPDAKVLEQGRLLFLKQANPTCATCHTLAEAGATGAIGPDLDELQPGHDQVRAVLRDGSGAMPSFAGQLSEEQLEAVTTYVLWATRPR
ncbi:MAG TPA: cytochrome c [Ottowia sp.]|uniref:SorU family sulfite dehydrogenase c-type cytochrome subunit n=1 Tax=Ottowia sp. TaxID=1898956 RepID=UPI002C523AEF|nr:cytochrome c [Ottowia sp.]HMN21595.1 cytochrome c [Ottowia sp.]